MKHCALTCDTLKCDVILVHAAARFVGLFLERGTMLVVVETLDDISVAWKLCYRGLNMILKESILMLTCDFVRSGGRKFGR
jgi:hypothetical protein